MKRLVLLGALLGLLNGLAAVAALHAVERAAPDELGWFAYAPLQEELVHSSYGFPWEYAVVPAVLVALNALLVPWWLRRSGGIRPTPPPPAPPGA